MRTIIIAFVLLCAGLSVNVAQAEDVQQRMLHACQNLGSDADRKSCTEFVEKAFAARDRKDWDAMAAHMGKLIDAYPQVVIPGHGA